MPTSSPVVPMTNNLPARVKFILVAGQSWPIPFLGPRQQRVIVPIAARLLKELMPQMFMTWDALSKLREKAIADNKTAEDTGVPISAPPTSQADVENAVSLLVGDITLSSQQYDDLVTIVVTALQKLHPAVTKEDFLDWEIDPRELVMSLWTIAIQVALIREQVKAVVPEQVTGAGEQTADGPKTGTPTTTV